MSTSTRKKQPAMIKVTSSNIESIGYVDLDLYVKFHNGTVYKHENVEPSLFQGFRETDSPGKFYAGRVKGKYVSSQVTIDEPEEEKQEEKVADDSVENLDSLQHDLGTGQSADPAGQSPADQKDISENAPGTGTVYAAPTEAERLKIEQEEKAAEEAKDAGKDGQSDDFSQTKPIVDDNGQNHPANSDDDKAHVEDIKRAVENLDPANDAHWTEDGKPDLNVLSDNLNRRVSRETVEAATQGARRPDQANA